MIVKSLFISEFIRIITTILILYTLNIPIFIKILLIMLTDLIDCDIPHLLYGPKKWINCKTRRHTRSQGLDIYQRWDKITDIICYTLLLFYILKYGGMSTNYNYLIILLFIYRLIGTYLFLIKNDRTYLFYFPNFFLEISLGLMVINHFPNLKKFKVFMISNIIVYKILLEYYLHVYKTNKK